jgi:hypothetical protein
MKNIIITLLVVFFSLQVVLNSTSAETLDDIADSPVFKEMTKRGQTDVIRTDKYNKHLPKNKEYSKLFIETKGPSLINLWLGIENPPFTIVREDSGLNIEPELLHSRIVYRNSGGKKIHVDIMIPNPNYISLVDFGLVPLMAQFEPPALKFNKRENTEVAGFKGELFSSPNDKCSYLFKLSKASLINVSSYCTLKEDMEEIITNLNIQRLDTKLNR